MKIRINNPVHESLTILSELHLPTPFPVYPIRVSIALFLLLLQFMSFGCAAIHRQPKAPVFSRDEAETIVSNISAEHDKVRSFYSLGNISVGDWKWEAEADSLIAGTREPFRIKIEITHPWGKPVLHILAYNNELQILSFQEKKLFIGEFTPQSMNKVFPAGLIDQQAIWAILRGYPHISGYNTIDSSHPDSIILKDQTGRDLQIIYPQSDNHLPGRIFFPSRHLEIEFSGFIASDGIYYASRVSADSEKGGKKLVIRNDKMVLNKKIPEEIFMINRPPGYEILSLDAIR